MSNRYWESRSQSQNIPITSIRCLVIALEGDSIQLMNVPATIDNLMSAEKIYASALETYESSTLASLEDTKTMQTNIEALIQASDTLHKTLVIAEEGLPSTLEFTHQGKVFSANRTAGSYKITWTESVELYDGRQTGNVKGGSMERTFVNALCGRYEAAKTRHILELSNLHASLAENDSELPNTLAKTLRIRNAWERAEEQAQLRNLIAERQQHVIETGDSMGFTSHLTEMEVEGEQEVIISLERFIDEQPKNATKSGMDLGFKF